MKDKFVLLTKVSLNSSPLITHHVGVFQDRVNVSNLKAETHSAEEEILQETPRNKTVLDNASLKEKGNKNSTLKEKIGSDSFPEGDIHNRTQSSKWFGFGGCFIS